jgi:hypothetical protein
MWWKWLLGTLAATLGLGPLTEGLNAYLFGPKMAETQQGIMAKQFARDRELGLLTSKALSGENEQLLTARAKEIAAQQAWDREKFGLQAGQEREMMQQSGNNAFVQQVMASGLAPSRHQPFDPSSLVSMLQYRG